MTEKKKNFKLLGVLFDEYLSFEDHTTNLCNKISKSLFCMNRVKNFVTSKAMKTMYFAMVHSHTSYCINVYSCANVTTLNKLVLKQKEAIRIICNAGDRDHTGRANIVDTKCFVLSFFTKWLYEKLHPLNFDNELYSDRVTFLSQQNPDLLFFTWQMKIISAAAAFTADTGPRYC